MQNMTLWWQRRTRNERSLATLACLAFIFAGGIDIGRSLFQATH